GGTSGNVVYDHLANRWLVTRIISPSFNSSELCVASSTTSDATGSYNRYVFHLGSRYYTSPHLGVWFDGYYMSVNGFDTTDHFLGPQAFALDRAAIVAGAAAPMIETPGITGGASEPSFLPADLDG